MTNYVDNILATYVRATRSERNEGMTWYNDAHALALELSPGDPWRGAGVIAAFSPMQRWDINVRNARNAFATGVATGHTKAMCGAAQSILDGVHPLDVLRGDKTRAFASAIATNGESEIATIDRHAHDIAMGEVFTDDTRKIGKRLYRELASAYSEAAFWCEHSVAQIQAITWLAWRNRK